MVSLNFLKKDFFLLYLLTYYDFCFHNITDESENEDISEEQLFCISTKPTLDNNSQSENNSEIPSNNKKRKKQQEKEGRKYPKYNEAMEQSYEKFLFGNSFPKTKIDESSSDSSSDESDIEDVGPVHKITAQVDSDSDSTDSGM